MIWLSVFASLALLYGLGEAIKNVKERNSDHDSFLKTFFVSAIRYIIMPFTYLVTLILNFFAGIFGIRKKIPVEDVTEEEIISMVNEGHEQGVLQASEAEMITNIVEFGDKEAKDIMTHRKNIIALDGNETLESAVKIILEEKNSRYPVYDENIDNIIGILHLKDAMRKHANAKLRKKKIKDIDDLIMEARFIPETRHIDILFNTMQSEKIHMVIVVDEYGQTAGLIAMEDILEEIVGNILDEYDEDETHITENEDNTYIMEGMTTLEEVEDILGITMEADEFDTLNGFLTARLGKIPEEDEMFGLDYMGYHFEVMSVENKMIATVHVTKLPPEDENETVDETAENEQPVKEVEEQDD